jgi:excisionase family DNA binding protein
MLHVGRDKVYYLLRTGQLRSLKIGKLRRITEQQLTEFIASLDKAVSLGTSRDVYAVIWRLGS